MSDTLIEDLARRYFFTRPRTIDFGLLRLRAQPPADETAAENMLASSLYVERMFSAAALFACAKVGGWYSKAGAAQGSCAEKNARTCLSWADVERAQSLLPSGALNSNLLPDGFRQRWLLAQQEVVYAWASKALALDEVDKPGLLCLDDKERLDLMVMTQAPAVVNYLIGLPFWWSRLHTAEQGIWVRVLTLVVAQECNIPSFRLNDFWSAWMDDCEIRFLQNITPPIINTLKAYTKTSAAAGMAASAVEGLHTDATCLHLSMRNQDGSGLSHEQIQAVCNNLKRADAVGVDADGVLHAILGLERESYAGAVQRRLEEKFPALVMRAYIGVN